MRLSILWRIMEIKEVRWGRRTRRITHSKISIILHMIQKPNYNLANIQSDWLQNKGKVTLGLDNYNSKNFSRKNIYLIIFNNNCITYNAQIWMYIWSNVPRPPYKLGQILSKIHAWILVFKFIELRLGI